MTRQEISDEVWAVLEPLMPTVTGRARLRTDHRLAVEGMAWKYRTGAPWRDVPERFGKSNSIRKRFCRWSEDGTWENLLAIQGSQRVARCFDKLKQWRGIAMRSEKFVRNCRAAVCLAATLISRPAYSTWPR